MMCRPSSQVIARQAKTACNVLFPLPQTCSKSQSRALSLSCGLPPVTICVIHDKSCLLLSRRSERINVARWQTLAEVAPGLIGAPWTARAAARKNNLITLQLLIFLIYTECESLNFSTVLNAWLKWELADIFPASKQKTVKSANILGCMHLIFLWRSTLGGFTDVGLHMC